MKLTCDQEIENLSLQINTGNIEIRHTCNYPDRDDADEIENLKN